MSKLFRLHTGAGENVEHWQQIPGHLSDNFINSIADPAGSNAQNQITSIPSPFARMDLVRTAFRYITSRGELEGTSIYHRLVSDCLDVAEIFFNIEAFSDKIEVLEWNSGISLNGGELQIAPDSDLGKLIHSTNPKHKLLGETLQMYLFQDATAFNFADLKHIYLLNYKQGKELINIIGGTSPATLFFSSGNDLQFVDIRFGNDRVFDNSYCALYQRSKEFIRFMYSFERAFPNFSTRFPDVKEYFDQTFGILDAGLQNIIRAEERNNTYHQYKLIDVGAENNNAEILGFRLRTKDYKVVASENENDFIIEDSKNAPGLKPCVLPTEPFNEKLLYAGGVWQQNFHQHVPFFDERPLAERTLPNQTQIKYPYLTVSDLLEPYLIKLPYPLDEDRFFGGHYEIRQGERDHGFALPVKKKYFEYFSLKDLQGAVSDGRKRFEMVQMPGGIKVVLRVPVKNNRYIQLSRIYHTNQFQDRVQPPNEKENTGVIIENQFTLAMYPFLQFAPLVHPHYRVLLVDRDVQPLTKYLEYAVKFYKESNASQSLPVVAQKTRSSKQQAQGVSTHYYVLEQNFDFVEVSHNLATGLIVPLFPASPAPSKSFKFAIDFGTTNTHIEYKIGADDARPFDITERDIQLGTLHSPGNSTEHFFSANAARLGIGVAKLTSIIREEFIPYEIKSSLQYKFPQRTVIYDNDMFNPDEPSYALADFNIPFWYLKESYNLSSSNSECTPNLKWADFKNNKKLERRTKGFLKQLMLMIRNKVLFNGGNLSSTEIVWFYPSSMPVFRRKFLQDAWGAYYSRYFAGGSSLYKMSESLAPFHFFKEKGGVIALDKPVACIDIGGGTTDVVIYHNNEPVVLTSFKFASNSLFGDGYGNTSATNGFVLAYEKVIRESLSNTVAQNLLTVYDSIKARNSRSIELIEFFFSLEENKLITDNRIPLAFSKLLAANAELKILFLLYYSAIIYHIGTLMKAKGLQPPRFITFSGNGSKIISIAAGGNDLESLTLFTRVIFADIYNLEQQPVVELKLYPHPKEITCKGGLECNDYGRYSNVEAAIKNVLVGTTDNRLVPEANIPYTQIKNEALVNAVCAEVALFFDKFFSWNKKINYYNYFGINPGHFERYKTGLKEDLKTFLLAGIEEKLQEVQDNTDVDIDETLFFYPLKGALNKLAYKIEAETIK